MARPGLVGPCAHVRACVRVRAWACVRMRVKPIPFLTDAVAAAISRHKWCCDGDGPART